MRVLIADDVGPVRSAIRRLLNEEKGLDVIGEATSLGEMIRIARSRQPDLILLDWELSGLPGSTKTTHFSETGMKRKNVILASLHLYQSHPKIIVLSSRPEAEAVSIAAGADAFVFKGDPPELLLSAIRSICPSD